METQENKSNASEPAKPYNDISMPDNKGRAMAGVIIVIVGGLLLARQTGADLPPWLFSWQMLIIAIGIFVGAKHSFRHAGWLIPVGLGVIFLACEYFMVGVDTRQFFWPVMIIIFGLFMIFKPNRRENAWKRWGERRRRDHFNYQHTEDPASGLIDSVTIFGGTKKVIISKDFRGGEAVTVFGGVEINLTQADIHGRAELDLTQIFGGAKLVVPSNWKIQAEEMVSIFGGLDDKRNPASLNPDPDKVLILKGTSIFGGIDIKSY